jgi:hypothetical protein
MKAVCSSEVLVNVQELCHPRYVCENLGNVSSQTQLCH